MSTATETAHAFVERINERDVPGIGALMTGDHGFVDALGKRFQGRAVMERAWAAFFAMFPDYQIAVELTVAEADRVALFGTARATHEESGEVWEVPAAWLAITRDGRVAEWRVFCDNGFGPLRDILARSAER